MRLRQIKILLTSALTLFLCSCNMSPISGIGTESLLIAPMLNKRQADVSKALDSTLPLRSIVYKYPQGGEYRSPFIFFDLDGNGREEAIILYSNLNETAGEVRAKVLIQTAQDVWTPVYDASFQTDQIEFVEFHKILNEDSSCMLVGCGGLGQKSPSVLRIYSLTSDGFKLEAAPEYYSYAVGDFNNRGLAEIAVIGRGSTRTSFNAGLLRGVSGYIELISELALSSDVEAPIKLTTGAYEGGKAIYIDEMLSGGIIPTIATEVMQITPSGLTMLVGGESVPRDAPDDPARSNYELTFRDESIYCMDFDGDGIVEIPYPVTLPYSLNNPDEDVPKLIQFLHLTALGFDVQGSAVTNADAGYLVYFPDRWQDNVTVESDTDNSEWRFRKWNHDSQEPAEELLRIRVSSTRNRADIFEDYITLEIKGSTEYSAYIPGYSDEPLAVTTQEAKRMFLTLPD